MADSYRFVWPLLRLIEPETAHRLTVTVLKTGLVPNPKRVTDSILEVGLWGLAFPNPVGLAAGFDKNAEVADRMLAQGFGFVEVGTVTPRPQHGNPRPRLFRLEADRAVINRFGFNNQGLEVVGRRLAERRQLARPGIVGANVGPNKDTTDPAADCAAGVRAFAGLADYLMINANVVSELDKASDPWGVKVLRYEIKNINPPHDVLSAMEKQMRAEREKRAVVLTSEGIRDAKINEAEGEKQRVIKESEAAKQQQINEAEGEAQAIFEVAAATAKGLSLVAQSLVAEGGEQAMQLRIAEAYITQFGELAKEGNTLVVPANLTDLSSMVALATTIARKDPPGRV